MEGRSRILAADDDEGVLGFLAETLEESGNEVLLARDGGEALEIFLAERPPLVLIDLRMPKMDGLKLMKTIKEIEPLTEILILTAYADIDSAVEAVRQGAFDYLSKPFDLERLGHRVAQALEHRRIVVERQTLLRELKEGVFGAATPQESVRRLRGVFEGSDDPLVIVDRALTVVAANPAVHGLAGIPAGDLVGRTCYRGLWGREDPCQACPVVAAFTTGGPASSSTELEKPGAGFRTFEIHAYPLPSPGAPVQEVVEHIRDVTEHQRAEEARLALRAQRVVDDAMRMVGKLLSKTAHDLINVFTVIKGRAHFLLEAIPVGDPRRSDVARIAETVGRGTGLVDEFRAFSVPMGVSAVNLGDLVEALVPTLHRLLGDRIDLQIRTVPSLWRVEADPAEMEQVILTLVADAGDAIALADADRGVVTIRTANAEIEEPSDSSRVEDPPSDQNAVRSGQYVLVAISGTTRGMAAAARRRIVEAPEAPRAVPKPSGLRSPMVSWIVERHNGYWVNESGLRQGPSFEIYLPRAAEK